MSSGAKRFFREASAREAGGGWTVELDGRPLRTPARQPLVVPTPALADAIAAEWNAQGDRIAPAAMPLTGFANAAIDRIAPAPGTFVDGLAAYAGSDVVCYRAEEPAALVERQAEAWDPLLAWLARRFDVGLLTVSGVMHRPQPKASLERLRAAVASFGPFELAAIHTLVTISGSLVVALAFAAGEIDEEQAWQAGQVDELYQAERWGEDPLATASRADRRAAFAAAARLLSLLRAG